MKDHPESSTIESTETSGTAPRGRFPRWRTLVRLALLALLVLAAVRDLLVAGLDLMEIAFRLEEHRRETGSYPPALDLLSDVPAVDPFSGEPYRYRLDEDGAVVYSVAGNRTDDGGTPPAPGGASSTPGSTTSTPELHAGDLVWRLPVTAP